MEEEEAGGNLVWHHNPPAEDNLHILFLLTFRDMKIQFEKTLRFYKISKLSSNLAEQMY